MKEHGLIGRQTLVQNPNMPPTNHGALYLSLSLSLLIGHPHSYDHHMRHKTQRQDLTYNTHSKVKLDPFHSFP